MAQIIYYPFWQAGRSWFAMPKTFGGTDTTLYYTQTPYRDLGQ